MLAVTYLGEQIEEHIGAAQALESLSGVPHHFLMAPQRAERPFVSNLLGIVLE